MSFSNDFENMHKLRKGIPILLLLIIEKAFPQPDIPTIKHFNVKGKIIFSPY